jgi:hypothetical protein
MTYLLKSVNVNNLLYSTLDMNLEDFNLVYSLAEIRTKSIDGSSQILDLVSYITNFAVEYLCAPT